MNIGDTVGDRIKFIRESAGLSQEHFADYLGIDQSHVSKIETGIATPSLCLSKLICCSFGVPEEWLMNGEVPKIPDLKHINKLVAEAEMVISLYKNMRASVSCCTQTGTDAI